MKILLWTNSIHEHSGYGKAARYLCEMWQEMGHEIAVAANSGIISAAINWKGIPIYPVRRGMLGLDVLPQYVAHFQPHIVFTLYDVWALPDQFRQRIGAPWVCYTPVDGEPINNKMHSIVSGCDWPVACSVFGQRTLAAVGIQADYIPLGVDTTIYKPMPKKTARQQLGFDEDLYIVGMVAANKGFPSRKSWGEAIIAFKLFYDKHPESVLYLHTTREPFGSSEGVHIDHLVARVGLPPESVWVIDQGELAVGIDEQRMAYIYNAIDVLLSPSMGEGFGLPILEAQACGTAVVTQDCTAMSEITWNGIATRPIQPFYHAPLDYFWYLASPERVAGALDHIHSGARDARHIGIEHAQQYSWDNLKAHWSAFWAKVEAEKW